MRHIEELAQVPRWCPFFSAPPDYTRSLLLLSNLTMSIMLLAFHEPLSRFPCFLELPFCIPLAFICPP